MLQWVRVFLEGFNMSDSWLFPVLAFGAVVGLPGLAIAWALVLIRLDRAKGRKLADSMGPNAWGSQDIDPRYRGNR
jgi:hypothetical protein